MTQIETGTMLPEISFGPISRAMLALYAGVSGDHDPVHIDTDFAKAAGLPDVFAHGMLSFGVLSRVVTQWCGAERLRAFGARFVSITHVHDVLTCRGRVTECVDEDGERRARIEVVVTAQDGRQTLVGEATVALG
ncbi:MaoC/PaaZ C-terminal domain-containing protein [Amycolatopsis pithecellobii]|uniref:Dehydratase n=1 Tax=Amycolatopsis pithecellobii TaxID=664692 RepID=A0A6N7ZB15_9PSEU|nr:MaoC/PaaZ C-terminal domain-containing protein [Amycolatopsis pithecellobii]MTD58954.1 dehydratase [Amycolatopsis pithecellobii]